MSRNYDEVEEIAQEIFEKMKDNIEFDDLSEEAKAKIYKQAEEEMVERRADDGDRAYDAWKDAEAERYFEREQATENARGLQND